MRSYYDIIVQFNCYNLRLEKNKQTAEGTGDNHIVIVTTIKRIGLGTITVSM